MTLKHAFLGVMTAGLLASVCDVDRSGSDGSGYYFTGRVFDGETGAALTDYSVTLSQAGVADQEAVVSEDGVYTVGPLKPYSDFVVTIDAGDDYREFFAAENMRTATPGSAKSGYKQTDYFEAYVFPTALESPAVTFEFYTEDSGNGTRPAGKVRFAPSTADGASELNLGGGSLPALPASTGDYWTNDADLKAGTVVVDFENGVASIDAGALVYGVRYQGVVYSVDGHAYEPFTFTAGLDGHWTQVLTDLSDDEALARVADSRTTEVYNEDGSVTFTFNYPIEFADATPEDVARERLDDGIAFTPTVEDDGDPAETCYLTGEIASAVEASGQDVGDYETTNGISLDRDDSGDQERNTNITIDGNTLTLSWPAGDRDNIWETYGEGNDASCNADDLATVTYNVAGISIRPVGSTEADARTLAALLGSATVAVTLVAPSAD